MTELGVWGGGVEVCVVCRYSAVFALLNSADWDWLQGEVVTELGGWGGGVEVCIVCRYSAVFDRTRRVGWGSGGVCSVSI